MGTCCGGDHQHKSGKSHSCCTSTQSRQGAPKWLWLVILAAIAGVGAASAVALVRQPPASPTVPASPPKKSEPPPGLPPKQVDPTDVQPKAPESAEGLIRHGRTDPIAKPEGAIRIASYNIENLFDTEGKSDEGGGGGGSSTPVKPGEHRKAVADTIRRINADILAVQEIESKETLTKFRDEYLKDLGYTHIASMDAGDPRGIEQSILSRYPITDEMNWPDTPLGGDHADKLGNRPNPEAGKPMILKRSPMRATVLVPIGEGKTLPITLFVVHHKASAYYNYLREAEGAKVLELVKEFEKEHPGKPVMVLGDFNARATEKSVRLYTGAGLVDAMTGVPGGVEATEFISHVSGRTIDHILINATAAAMVSRDTRFVLGTMQRPEHLDWRRTLPPAGYASDHYPVVMDLLPTEMAGSTVRRGLSASAPAAPPATDSK